ncbi:MAG: TOBE domain-containing protein [Gammaproteobacteria bacterium]
MKISARNQFPGTVSDIHTSAVYTEVVVRLQGGTLLVVAMITRESAEALNIKPGVEVIALVKAPQILIVTDFGGYRISARNQLHGNIVQMKPGAINTEVVIALNGGERVTATVTNDSVEALGLRLGQPATAVLKSSAVILAVAG